MLWRSRSCAVFTRYPLYRESALRKAKKCRLVLGLLKFSALVLVFFLSLVFTQSLRNYWSRGSQKYSPACKNRNEFECENVINTEINSSQCEALLFMLDLFISHVLFCCYHCNACLVCLPDTHTQTCLYLLSMGAILNYKRRCPCVWVSHITLFYHYNEPAVQW